MLATFPNTLEALKVTFYALGYGHVCKDEAHADNFVRNLRAEFDNAWTLRNVEDQYRGRHPINRPNVKWGLMNIVKRDALGIREEFPDVEYADTPEFMKMNNALVWSHLKIFWRAYYVAEGHV